MAETPQKPASPSRKRPAPDDIDLPDAQATPVKDPPSSPHSSDLSTPKSIASPYDSPLPQSSAPSRSPAPNNPTTTATTSNSAAGATPAKRRRLTAQEKEQQRLEKEAKAQALAKAREEKRLQKEEENRQKEEQKKAREEAKKAKEEEVRKKNEEKEAKKREKQLEEEKKAKAQPKLNKWFTMNATGGTAELAHRRKSISAEPNEAAASSVVSTPQKKTHITDYEQTFLPYEKKTHEVLASHTLFWADRSDADKEAAITRLNEVATSGSEQAKQQVLHLLEKRDYATLLGIPVAEQGKRGVRYPRVRDIVSRLQGSSDQPVDLTEESSEKKMRELLETLKTIPMKYIHFTEDVRPPYCGTFTKIQSDRESRRLAVNPFSKSLPEANYDYESEYEWDDAEEGEDLDAEDEEDLESEGAEDLEDFLELDDEAAHSKRRLITGDLEPVCSGLNWEDSKGVLRGVNGSTDANAPFSEYRMGILLEPQPTSIDPFSTVYWQTEPSASTSGTRDVLGMMQPPRLPLHARSENGASVNGVRLPTAATNGSAAPKPPKRTIPEEFMGEFKDAVKGSDLTKLALIEALKKKFPKIPKDAISNTLPLVAARVGPTAAEKRWTLLDT